MNVEAEQDAKSLKSSKDKFKNVSEKSKKQDSLSEAPAEIDSRILSALLTASKVCIVTKIDILSWI